uniref:Uncharacterized protein n=1 Tax=Schistocephalus solidus TaxID=70667 RepID=A0A0X3Q6Z4_SCHSO
MNSLRTWMIRSMSHIAFAVDAAHRPSKDVRKAEGATHPKLTTLSYYGHFKKKKTKMHQVYSIPRRDQRRKRIHVRSTSRGRAVRHHADTNHEFKLTLLRETKQMLGKYGHRFWTNDWSIRKLCYSKTVVFRKTRVVYRT